MAGKGHGRDYDHYSIIPQDGGDPIRHVRATTVAGALEDPPSEWNPLVKWYMRMCVRGLVARPDLWALAQVVGPDTDWKEKRALNDICADARKASASEGRANLGTALHKLTERLEMGATTTVPPMFEADVLAYRTTLAALGIQVDPRYIERVCAGDAAGEPIAGTVDRIVTWRKRRYIGDLKTGKSLDFAWLKIAVQLAIYANAAALYRKAETAGDWLYDEPMPDVDRLHGIVFHLPAGSGECTPYLVDLTVGWEAARLAVAVRSLRGRKEFAKVIGTPLGKAA
jgi:hypothetical protein